MIIKLPTAELCSKLRAYTEQDAHRRAAVHVLTGYSGGTLLDHSSVRQYLAYDVAGRALYVRWHSLGTALAATLAGDATPDVEPLVLNHSGTHALRLACALAGEQTVELGKALAGFDARNRRVAVEAVAMAAMLPLDALVDAQTVNAAVDVLNRLNRLTGYLLEHHDNHRPVLDAVDTAINLLDAYRRGADHLASLASPGAEQPAG